MDFNNCSLTKIGVYQETETVNLSKDLILGKLMTLLSLSEFAAMAGVCKKWKQIIQPHLDEKLLSEVVFGKKQWEQVPGVADVGVEPKLTKDQKARLIAKFKGVCPFFNKPDDSTQAHRFQNDKIKRVWQTFKVILIPKEINGKPVDMNLIGTVFSFTKKAALEHEVGTGFHFVVGDKNSPFCFKKAERSYFLIVSLDVIPGSRKLTAYDEKERLLHPHKFRAPNPLEASIMTFVMNLGPFREVGKGDFYGASEEACDYFHMITDTEFIGGRLLICAGDQGGVEVSCDLDGHNDYYCAGVAAVAEVL